MSQEEKDYMSSIPYLSAVGSLMYLAIGTRPDIAFAVGLLSRFNSCPAKVHWNAIQHVFKYLRGTVDFGLELGPSGPGGVVSSVFSDSDYAGDTEKPRSTSGYPTFIGASCVNCLSRPQVTTAEPPKHANRFSSNGQPSHLPSPHQFLQPLPNPQPSPYPPTPSI